MSSLSKVAVCQMTSVADKQTNMDVVTKLIERASKENVQMMFFPEACDFICDNKKDIPKFSEPIIGGPTVNRYRELALKHNVWLSMGGLHEKDSKDPSKVFNTHVIIDNQGKIVQTYRKLHLFDVEIPAKNVRLKESDFCNPGENIVAPVATPAGRIGLAICYDLRFPEMCTQLAILGTEMLTFPSAFTYATGEAHWHILLRQDQNQESPSLTSKSRAVLGCESQVVIGVELKSKQESEPTIELESELRGAQN
ncbi:Nitrilase and fragile histidine triad fusion protein NitFhit [Eumeta japonica]|uniref:Nitrilase and fragile histidine triad fusion protein NitFhit n=1 Tax=Eumeta variegata TaxID=151549 RepID=A0A4C1UEB0_EUMVA|nr:Nitrilase and fragile histidine triad fusion protein NitFhit [Eumeta japonica]